MNWTDERVEQLKKLWAEGYSASQIAAQLGGVTRNAVIGKAHRLKLAGRIKAQPRLRKPAAPLIRPAADKQPQAEFARAEGRETGGNGGGGRMRRRAGSVSVVGANALQMNFAEDALPEENRRLKPRENVVVSMARHLSLMQLTEHTCKWPVGDPLSEDFYFCGADSDDSGPYCACHAKLAFNSDKRRR